MTPVEFLTAILTDKYPNKTSLKTDALSFYTQIIQSSQGETILTILPFQQQVLSIPAASYREALKLYQAGQKINAIKTIRCNGWMGSDKTATPDLKWTKEFVESFPGPISTSRTGV
jgi:hypothetical protein